MRIEQGRWMSKTGWAPRPAGEMGSFAQLALVFGSREDLKNREPLEEIRRLYPSAHLFGCTTAGEICSTEVTDDSIVVTAVRFDHTCVVSAAIHVDEVEGSYQAGQRLAGALDAAGLRHVFVLSDGLRINGSDLVRGLSSALPPGVTVTGGLSADGARFEETLVLRDGVPSGGAIAVLGLYGDRLRVGFGSLGGWDPFGPERLITRSKGNVLYEMDGRSALELYKTYLGEHAAGLPATGLFFPLSLRSASGETGVVRTILSVDEREHSMTFAGDVPQGSYARLMKANADRLIDGAVGAARTSFEPLASSPDLAILISCVGRKLVLKQRIEEEVEGVRDVLGWRTALTGFYSYGELSPFGPQTRCELHNQTMTITTFSEV